MDITALNRMIADDAALRRRQRLQPVGGKGDKIFPPTYPGEGRNPPPRHVYERRRLNGADVWCVLVDSVQSQANRLEECLLDAIRDGVAIPYVEVDFTGARLDGISKITSLDAPHRRLEGHWGSVDALCVLPDGRLASGSGDDTIRLWDVTAGDETARLEGHSGSVYALCMLPDGRLASGSGDDTIRLRDVTAGDETARLEIDAPIHCVLALPTIRLVAGDAIGRLHWLEIVD
jgi:WD40 repeat protein